MFLEGFCVCEQDCFVSNARGGGGCIGHQGNAGRMVRVLIDQWRLSEGRIPLSIHERTGCRATAETWIRRQDGAGGDTQGMCETEILEFFSSAAKIGRKAEISLVHVQTTPWAVAVSSSE